MNIYLSMENLDHILLFKTDIKTEADKLALQYVLDNDENISQWSLDLEDEDCVLRVISYTLKHKHIINLIKLQGYQCSELT